MIRTCKAAAFILAAAIIINLILIAGTAFALGQNPGQEYVKLEVETVAGLDCQKAVDIMFMADEAEREKKIREDTDLLAHLIYAENGDDSYSEYMRAMEYTGSVVLNRVASSRYPDSLEGVIYQRGQYACTWDGHINRNPSDEAYEIAEELIRNGSVLPGKVLFAAEFRQGHVYDIVAGTYYCY